MKFIQPIVKIPKIIDTFRGEYAFLSNMYPCKMPMKGLTYSCLEEAYQAMKCEREKDRERFVGIGGVEAKKLGRKILLREDWELQSSDLRDVVTKDMVMWHMLCIKFCRMWNPNLVDKLLATRNAIITHKNNWKDIYWGVCWGDGEDKLGKMLMDVRRDQLSIKIHSIDSASKLKMRRRKLGYIK